MASVFDFLHIKGQTAGSSNELSLDVLEQRSVEANGKANRQSKLPKAPKASQGSYHGVAESSTLSGQAEVEKRKKARHAHRIRLQIIGFVAIAALIGFGIYAGVRYHEDKVDIEGRIVKLVERLSVVDDTLVDVDALMVDPFDPEKAEARGEVIADSAMLKTELNRIATDAQTLSDLPLEETTLMTIKQIGEAAKARSAMLTAAEEAFRLSSDIATQAQLANSIWGNVIDADQHAREAIAAANRASSPDATRQALELLNSAKQEFEDARYELNQMSASYGISFTDQVAYLSKKIEAMEKAIETSEALLAGDREAAKAANDAYNSADAEAADLAAGLPLALTDLVESGFKTKMEDCQKRYNNARSNTVEIDSIIREYVG